MVSMRRTNDFLLLDEIDKDSVTRLKKQGTLFAFKILME